MTEEEHARLYIEVKNATLQGVDTKIVELFNSGEDLLDNKVNSLLLWVLNLTKQKPIDKIDIMSPGSYADVDLDFPQSGREKVFDYLKEKYGKDKAVHVATFGTMGAKGSIKNAARALGYSIELGNKISKYIPELPGVTLQQSIDVSKDLQDLILKDKEAKHIMDTARKLEGLQNSIGMHASGFILCDTPITDHIPLMVATKKDSSKIMTQFEYYDVEENFLLKWDVLGLQTLDILQKTVQLIKKYKNVDINIDLIDINDPNIYKLINNGLTTLIFQLDGSMGSYIPRWQPQNIQEISDLSACARPGPLEMGLIDKYIEAKFENKKYDYGLKDQKLIKKIWDICHYSYGLILYQEELIACFTEIGDFDPIESDNARRVTSKKKPEEMIKLKEKFVPRAIAKGYNKEDVENLFEQFQSFSAYSFNLSHKLCAPLQ